MVAGARQHLRQSFTQALKIEMAMAVDEAHEDGRRASAGGRVRRGLDVEVILVNCHYPVTQTSFTLQFGLIVRKIKGLDDAAAQAVAEKFTNLFAEGFMEDVAIWRSKSPIQNPLLCEEDGPVYQLRRWYEQFYVDAAEVTPEMTQRFEFEVDTTHANENWQREVEENLRRRQQEDEQYAGGAGHGHGHGHAADADEAVEAGAPTAPGGV